jgi:hypothetical protein
VIADRDIAKQITDMMLDTAHRLDKSLAEVRDKCPQEEFHDYRKAVGRVLAEMLLEVLNPLFAKHPELKPPGIH